MSKSKNLRWVAYLLAAITLLSAVGCSGDGGGSGTGTEVSETTPTELPADPPASGTTESETLPAEATDAPETDPPETAPATSETEEADTEPSTTPPPAPIEGLLMTDYNCADYTDLTENGYAKIEGNGASLTVDGIDGGEKGGKTTLTMTFCSEPNFDTAFEIEVNGEVMATFTNNGSNWFEMKKKTFKITLEPGSDNVIRIVTPTGKVSHIATLTVGDVDPNDLAVSEVDRNKLTYSFMEGDPPDSEVSGGKTYAKLGLSQSVTLTGIDGGERGGLCYAYVRTTTQPGVATTLRISVNNNRSVTVRVVDISQGWFQFFNSSFETFLKPGKTNTVTVQVIEGGLTHMEFLAVGATDGSTENPYAAVAGEEVGMENASINGAVSFLQENGMLPAAEVSIREDCIAVLTRMVGTKATATTLFDTVCPNGAVTQRQGLTMLLRAMGYGEITVGEALREAQVKGILGNLPSSSYGDLPLDRDRLAAFVYTALSALSADGKVMAEVCGITLPAVDSYGVTLIPQDTVSTVDGTTATVVSRDAISYVTTADRYRRFTLETEVKADTANAFVMGFRLDSASHGIYDSGIWLKFANQNVELTSDGHTVYMEVPMGLFNVTEGVTLRAVDSGSAINLYAVIGDAAVPFLEIRFEDGYAIGYLRGHLIHGLKADNVSDAGHIALAANGGTVTYSHVTISDPDPVQNLPTDYPEVAEGESFEITESFEQDLYDYNAFFGTGGGLSVRDGKLVFRAIGRENIFSTVMRVEDGVLEATVLPGSGEMQFQLGASSPLSAGYYYCGLRFTVKAGRVELYHNTGNMDEQATVETLIRTHGINISRGYRVRLADRNGEITFSMKELDDDAYTLILRILRKDTYLSVLDKSHAVEEAHFDKLMRGFGYLRIVSEGNATVDDVSISGKGYLPYEQMEIRPAPAPDEGKLLEADDLETLVGVGYIPYFTRYRVNGVNATRPSVEDLLSSVVAASKLKGNARTEALSKLYWGYAWWATPAQGMYCGRDAWAAKNNLLMIAEAGIDFIFIDQTNFNGGCTPDDIMNNIEVILEAALELEAEGKPYPKISFWNNVRNEPGWERGGYEDTAREIWQVFISNPRYRNLWVYYHGKPLMMYTFGQPAPYLGMSDVAEIREMWTNSGIKNTWSFHQDPPFMEGRGGCDADGNLEQINVLPYGKTTFNGNISSLESTVKNGTGGREGGRYYKKYWEKAFAVRPKFVTLWAYNHWDVNFRQPDQSGNVYWGDNFSQEYSGGLEPIAGNFTYKGVEYPGDSYYEWTREYIRAYKAGEPIPEGLYVPGD